MRLRSFARAVVLAATLSSTLFSNFAQANIGDIYGFGSRSAGLAGAGVAWGFEGFAAYSNPAALALPTEKRLTLSWGLLNMNPRFTPINNIIVENEYTSDKVTRSNVEQDYRATFGQVMGINYQLFPKAMRLTLGLTSFIPLEQIAYMDTGESFVPEYFLYRSRTQRPQFEMAMAINPLKGVYLGAGAHLAFALTGSGSVFLQTKPDKPSTMRFGASLKPRAAPYAGILLRLGHDFPGVTGPDEEASILTIGSVIRFPIASNTQLQLESGARAFGDLAALDFNFQSKSAIFYDPWTLETGMTIRYTRWTRLFLQADRQKWSKFQPPALSIQKPTTENCEGQDCGIDVSGSNNPTFAYRDIWIPKVGHEIYLGPVTLRGGYAFRPSIIKDLPNGVGNYLDPSKHMYTAGLGFKFKRFLSFDVPCNFDIHGAYHRLVSQTIVKTDGDERGRGVTPLKIGSPGYQAGGKIYGGGLSLTLAF